MPAPAVLQTTSIVLASRVGMNICVVSIANDSSRPAPVAAVRRTSVVRRPANATKNPSGAYARRLITTSDRVKRGGQGANRKKGTPGSGAIQAENDSRLA